MAKQVVKRKDKNLKLFNSNIFILPNCNACNALSNIAFCARPVINKLDRYKFIIYCHWPTRPWPYSRAHHGLWPNARTKFQDYNPLEIVSFKL